MDHEQDSGEREGDEVAERALRHFLVHLEHDASYKDCGEMARAIQSILGRAEEMTRLLVAWLAIVQPSLAVYWLLRERQLRRPDADRAD
jgi:hypothetical protein